MDERYLEMAEKITLAETQAGVDNVRLRAQRKPLDFVGNCLCGEKVPKKRIAAGYFNCIECQTAIEQKGKAFSK